MPEKIKILSVNTSSARGRKFPVEKLLLDQTGAEGDAHAGTIRQISLFDIAHAKLFSDITGAKPLEYGQFAENISYKTDDELEIKIFDRFVKDDIILEVTQHGKPFHDQFREPGNYVMPREGIFCRVKSGGIIQAGDEMEFIPKVFVARIITLSDRASRGIYDDLSGPAVMTELTGQFKKIGWRLQTENIIIPDDENALRNLLKESLDNKNDFIITTGGTGIGPRDITPEVMKDFIQKEIPGIIEMIRWKYGIEKPAALVSRAIAGVSGKTLMFALPGSLKAVNEYMAELKKHFEHLVYMVEAVELH